jgi:hypothetical protein
MGAPAGEAAAADATPVAPLDTRPLRVASRLRRLRHGSLRRGGFRGFAGGACWRFVRGSRLRRDWLGRNARWIDPARPHPARFRRRLGGGRARRRRGRLLGYHRQRGVARSAAELRHTVERDRNRDERDELHGEVQNASRQPPSTGGQRRAERAVPAPGAGAHDIDASVSSADSRPARGPRSRSAGGASGRCRLD